MAKRDPFKYFKSSLEIIRLAVMLYVRFPLSLRNVEDLLHERGIDVSYETVRYWWNRFGPSFASEIRRKRVQKLRAFSTWQWHVDEVFVKIKGERHYLWRAVDHEGEVLESVVTKRRNKRAALKILRKKCCGATVDQRCWLSIASLPTGPRCVTSDVMICRHVGAGSRTVLRIHTCHSDEGSAPCSASLKCGVFRNSLLSTLPFSTTSIRAEPSPDTISSS